MAKKRLADALDSILGSYFTEEQPKETLSKDTIHKESLGIDSGVERSRDSSAIVVELDPPVTEHIESVVPSPEPDTGTPKDSLPKESIPKYDLDKLSLPKVNFRDRGNFTQTDNDIFDYLPTLLDPTALVVYLYFYRRIYGNNFVKNSEIAVSYEEIQDALGISHVTAAKHIKTLVDKGLLEVAREKNAKQSRSYILYLPSQVDGLIPKDYLGINALPKDSISYTESFFRSSGKETLPKDDLGNGPEQGLDEQSQPSKYSTKYIIKDSSSKKEELLQLFGSYGIKINEPKLDQWANDDSLSADIIVQYLDWAAENKKSVGMLVAAIDQRWGIDQTIQSPRGPQIDVETLETRARQEEKEQQRLEAYINTLDPSLKDELLKQAEAIASKDEFFRKSRLAAFREGCIRNEFLELIKAQMDKPQDS
jgi:DNA-binding MarR family transcriptional regulator